MTNPSDSASLQTTGGQDITQSNWDVGTEGLELMLHMAKGRELSSDAVLKFLPAIDPNSKALHEETLSAIIDTENGILDPAQSISRLTADWGGERPLSCIGIKTGTPCKARIKIFSRGVWLPLTPSDIIATGSEQRFSPVMAGKIMIELVVADTQYPGVWHSKSTTVQELSLKAALLPADLSLAVADSPAFFHWSGLLPKAGVSIDGFATAVNNYLTKPNATETIPLKLSNSLPGKIGFEFTPGTVNVVKQLDNASDGQLHLAWKTAESAEGTGKITLKKAAQLSNLSFNIQADLQPASILGTATRGSITQSQLCTPVSGIAQGFSIQQSPASALIGVDLPFLLRSDHLSASLALHPDLVGQPGSTPYSGAVFSIEWPANADPRDSDGWMSIDFPHPIQLPDLAWWVVLQITEGEILWPLQTSPPIEASGCVYRQHAGSWLPRSDTNSLWALIRLRVQAPKLEPSVSIRVRRGNQSVTLKADDQGLFRLDAARLKTINQAEDDTLEILGSAPCAGILNFSELRAVYR